MRVGVICEGAKTDAAVLERLLQHSFQKVAVVNLDRDGLNAESIRKASVLIKGVSKREIFSAPDVLLMDMFARGVRHVMLIWDLLPPGHQMGVTSQWSDRPNRTEQRQMLLQKLCRSTRLPQHLLDQARHIANRYGYELFDVEHPNGNRDLFCLTCVCYMMDGWLLADGAVLRDLASTAAHQADKWSPPHPETCQNPATELRRYFGRGSNPRLKFYNKHAHNIVVLQSYLSNGRADRFRVSPSFCRVVGILETWLNA